MWEGRAGMWEGRAGMWEGRAGMWEGRAEVPAHLPFLTMVIFLPSHRLARFTSHLDR